MIGTSPEKFAEVHPKYRKQVLDIESQGLRWNLIEWWMLNHKDAKILVYSALAELEEQLGTLIEGAYTDSEEILSSTTAIRNSTENRWEQAGKPGSHGVPKFAYFPELIEICRQSPRILNAIGVPQAEFDRYTEELTDVRSDVMHPINTVIDSKEDVGDISETVKNIEDLLSLLDEGFDGVD